jgi:hypothetical protein
LTRCPSLVGTSLPGRDSWALEEFMDTVITADPEAEVRSTEYRGVFVAYSLREPIALATRFLSFTHAFLARVYPVMLCGGPQELDSLVSALLSHVRVSEARLEVKLREPLSRQLTESRVVSSIAAGGLRPSKRSELVVLVETLWDLVLLSYGRLASCGPRCRLLLPRASQQ